MLGNSVARENGNAIRRGKRRRVEVEMQGKLLVQPDKPRRSDLDRSKPRIEALGKPRVAIVKGKQKTSPASVRAGAALRCPLTFGQDKHKSEAGNRD